MLVLGALLHYDDPSLKELYFLDPQWLCDMLAHIVTVRSVNPCIKNGIVDFSFLRFIKCQNLDFFYLRCLFNPLSANPINGQILKQWSNSVFDHFWGLSLKGLRSCQTSVMFFTYPLIRKKLHLRILTWSWIYYFLLSIFSSQRHIQFQHENYQTDY